MSANLSAVPPTLVALQPQAIAAYLRSHDWEEERVTPNKASTWAKPEVGTDQSFRVILPLNASMPGYVERLTNLLKTLETAERRSRDEILFDLYNLSSKVTPQQASASMGTYAIHADTQPGPTISAPASATVSASHTRQIGFFGRVWIMFQWIILFAGLGLVGTSGFKYWQNWQADERGRIRAEMNDENRMLADQVEELKAMKLSTEKDAEAYRRMVADYKVKLEEEIKKAEESREVATQLAQAMKSKDQVVADAELRIAELETELTGALDEAEESFARVETLESALKVAVDDAATTREESLELQEELADAKATAEQGTTKLKELQEQLALAKREKDLNIQQLEQMRMSLAEAEDQLMYSGSGLINQLTRNGGAGASATLDAMLNRMNTAGKGGKVQDVLALEQPLRQLLAQLNVAHGEQWLAQGNMAMALLRFTEAVRYAEGDIGQERLHRDRLSELLSRFAGSLHVVGLENNTGKTLEWSTLSSTAPVADLLMQAQLISRHRIDGRGQEVTLDSDALAGIWGELNTKYADRFVTSRSAVVQTNVPALSSSSDRPMLIEVTPVQNARMQVETVASLDVPNGRTSDGSTPERVSSEVNSMPANKSGSELAVADLGNWDTFDDASKSPESVVAQKQADVTPVAEKKDGFNLFDLFKGFDKKEEKKEAISIWGD